MVDIVKMIAGVIVGLALCFTSTVAATATVPSAVATGVPMSITPYVALSAFGTMQSQSAVCAPAVDSAGAAAAAEGQASAQGCVLLVFDPAAAPIVADAPIAAPVGDPPVAASGFGIGAIVAGLIAIASLAAALRSSDGNGKLPIGPD